MKIMILLVVAVLIAVSQTVICFRQQDLFKEIEQLNEKVADLEKENQSQPDVEINSNEVVKATKEFMSIF